MKKIIYTFIMLFVGFSVVGCTTTETTTLEATETTTTITEDTETTVTESTETDSTDSTVEEDLTVAERAALLVEDVDWDEADYSDYLNDDSVVVLDGDSESYYIDTEGTYVLEGTITETVTVEVAEDEDVNLILNNVMITTTENAAIVVLEADETTITVLEGTVNTLTDSETYTTEGEDYDAVIYSKTDLIMNGTGTLNIVSNYNDGIICKDDLMMVNLTLTVNSVDDGINGKDSLSIQDVSLTLVVDGDGLKSTQDNSDEEGFIYITGGTFEITATKDGIDAYNYVVITGGDFTITAEDKGITADSYIYISAGTFYIDSLDDAVDYNCESDTEGATFQEVTD